MTESELVLMAKNGDTAAFSRLYGCYKDKLFRYAYYKLGNVDDAEDAVQSCLLSAFEQIGKLKKAESFSSWIFKILSVYCANYIKEQIKRRNTDDLESYSDISSPNSDSLIEETELRECLNKLSEKEREIVFLSVIAGFKSKEVGKIAGYSAGNVRTILSRSLSKMKKELTERSVNYEA